MESSRRRTRGLHPSIAADVVACAAKLVSRRCDIETATTAHDLLVVTVETCVVQKHGRGIAKDEKNDSLVKIEDDEGWNATIASLLFVN